MKETSSHEPAPIQGALRELGDAAQQLADLCERKLASFRRRDQRRYSWPTADEAAKLSTFYARVREARTFLLNRLMAEVPFQMLIDERTRVMKAVDEWSYADLEYDGAPINGQLAELIRQEHRLRRLLELPFEIGEDVFSAGDGFRVFILPNGDTLQAEDRNGTFRYTSVENEREGLWAR